MSSVSPPKQIKNTSTSNHASTLPGGRLRGPAGVPCPPPNVSDTRGHGALCAQAQATDHPLEPKGSRPNFTHEEQRQVGCRRNQPIPFQTRIQAEESHQHTPTKVYPETSARQPGTSGGNLGGSLCCSPVFSEVLALLWLSSRSVPGVELQAELLQGAGLSRNPWLASGGEPKQAPGLHCSPTRVSAPYASRRHHGPAPFPLSADGSAPKFLPREPTL